MAIFVTIIFLLFTRLFYLALYVSTLLVRSLKKVSVPNENKKKYRLTILFASLFMAGLATYLFLFTSPATNYKTAYIEKAKQGYKVTVKGRRLYMSHDLSSIFLRNTYPDSVQYIIPRSEGIVNGEELPTKEGHYKFAGKIIIQDKHLKIDFYADNNDDKTLHANSWNGEYNLIWR